MFFDKKTLLKIWLNPGLNLISFQGTGPWTFNETCMCFASEDAFQKPVFFHVWHTLLLSHPSRVLFNQALFRIAVGLLKVQQPALLQLSCPLDMMQYMKRATRVTYDKDQLIKVSLLNDFQCSP